MRKWVKVLDLYYQQVYLGLTAKLGSSLSYYRLSVPFQWLTVLKFAVKSPHLFFDCSFSSHYRGNESYTCQCHCQDNIVNLDLGSLNKLKFSSCTDRSRSISFSKNNSLFLSNLVPVPVLIKKDINKILCRSSSSPHQSQSIVTTNLKEISKPISKKLTRMASVQVKDYENDSYLHITIDLPVSQTSDAMKTFNLNRQKTELLEPTFARLRASLTQKLRKKKLKKKSPKASDLSGESSEMEQDDVENISIQILHNGTPVDMSTANKDAWKENAILRVGDNHIPVVINAPSVILKGLSSIILAGFPIFPDAEFEFTERQQCEFYWKSFDSRELNRMQHKLNQGSVDTSDMTKGVMYTPSREEIGCHIIVVCVPRNGGKVGKFTGVISKCTISAGPGPCPFEKRHQYTKSQAQEGRFRVLCYNILARVYSDTEVARTQLFKHCPPEFLDMDYRKHLLLNEILGYNSDLLCLQEVDKSMFESQLTPGLEIEGCRGLFLPKDGSVSEGCATFYRTSKFSLVNQANIVLSNFLKTDHACKDLWKEVSKLEALKEKVEQRSSVLQVTVFSEADNPDRLVCLANTHFFYHPTACNIRLIHAAVALRHLQNVVASYRQIGKTVALVFCGDFNSRPALGVYQLMTCQYVPSDHFDWTSAEENEQVTTLELSHPMNIENTYGQPAYTNYTLGFQATLDYIFMDTDVLEVCSNVPLPSHEEVTLHQALPNVVFPSDHLALISDLKFK